MAKDLPGRPGNLTAEQEVKLKELWLALFEILGIIEPNKYGATLSRASSTASSPQLGSESPNPQKQKKLSWLGRHKSPKGSPEIGTEPDIADDKHGLSKDFKRALASQSQESIRRAFWDMTKHDNPDAILLRFLRARKWEVHDALVMMISAFHWRSVDMKVDQELMSKGEAGFLKLSQSGEGTAQKDAADFIKQFHMGKSMLHGLDTEDRPITVVRARLHHPNQETERSLEMYTVYVIETARMMLRPPVDTATIIFDMTGFSLSNMDYAPVKFMIKCFEANYPESLGSVLVYKAPWLFSGIWKIIRGWLDPVVASKVHFCSDESELSQYVSRPHMLKELGGDEDWEYKYIPPVAGENDRMDDVKTRDDLQQARRKLSDEYERLTLAWARENDRDAAPQRTKIADQLRDNYWRLDPYVRARSLWDRTGVIGEAGKLAFYPSAHSKPAEAAQDGAAAELTAKTAHLTVEDPSKDIDGASVYSDAKTHIDDVD
ncbi:CRAL/TRIO domain-containing protein [Myriangium duriaei CBS 260.36]|uniref:CRAL/TRIO domain-containing protein n=1 Tax=Myriangium duriaei CBS 260.36 TaxID=1168546 RepID=A0A9P4J5L0_9PEZI|nr:CRAL/TRIO domain-containing protein [Myriangium duriaei CBS 260.36]